MIMFRRMAAGILAVSIITLSSGLASAHADDTGFLNELHQAGEDIQPLNKLPFLLYGKSMCDNLRRGYDPFRATTFLDRASHGDVVLHAAQHNLCPDTLPPPPT